MTPFLRLRDSRLLVPAYVLFVTLVVGLVLVLQRRTFSTIYGQDLFVFLDGAWRVVSGQLPNRDFHTPLGLIAYVLPGLAFAMTGNLGLTMPMSMLLFVILLLLPMIWLVQSRLPLWLAILFTTYLIVLTTAPINLGEPLRNVSFAVYYNRWGWAALSLVFVALAPRRNILRWGEQADAVMIGLLLTVLFLLKISYFVVGAGYILGMVIVARTRGTATWALATAAVFLALAALLLGTMPGYIADIWTAAAASGIVRQGISSLITMALTNGRPLIVLGFIAVIAWTKGVRWTEIIAAIYIVLSSVVLANQNYHSFELPPLVAAAIVLNLAGQTRRVEAGADAMADIATASALLVLTYGPLVFGIASLAIHLTGAARGQPAAFFDGVSLAALPQNTQDLPANLQSSVRRLAAARELGLSIEPSAAEYGVTLEDGVALLRSNPALAGTVETLDLANPFNVLLRRPPPRHDNSWNHLARTFSDTVHLAPEDALRDVAIIMEPKVPAVVGGTSAMLQIDRSYMAEHFHLAAESSFWRAYARTDRRP